MEARPSEQDFALAGAEQEGFHERAAAATRSRFGNAVFVRAVVEVSNFCRENCAYCGMRRDNKALARFRARHDDLAELLLNHLPASVTDVNIQAGEDPVAVREIALPLVKTLRRETKLGVSVCLGTLPPSLYADLHAAGAEMYIMKFECADPVRYAALEAPGSYEERLAHIRLLAAEGWAVSSGFIAGLPGQGPREMMEALALANSLPIQGCSVSPFVPGEDTPLGVAPARDANLALNCMAAMRLMRPDWVIPAVSALNLAEKDGYARGLAAGANLVTMNMTPDDLRENYLIYKRERFIMTEERALAAIDAAGLVPSPTSLAGWYRHIGGKTTRAVEA